MKQGDVIRVPYPFHASGSEEFGFYGSYYTPGCLRQGRDADQSARDRYYIDGWGEMVLTIVSIHTPPGFRERVFYTRKWVDPDGKEFGKNTLFVRSAAEFTKLAQGHRHAHKAQEAGK